MDAESKTKRYVLRLYSADRTGETRALAAHFKELIAAHYGANSAVEVVDVLQSPEQAVQDQVFVTPAMVKAFPEPVRHVIGNLYQPDKILMLLGVFETETGENNGEP